MKYRESGETTILRAWRVDTRRRAVEVVVQQDSVGAWCRRNQNRRLASVDRTRTSAAPWPGLTVCEPFLEHGLTRKG